MIAETLFIAETLSPYRTRTFRDHGPGAIKYPRGVSSGKAAACLDAISLCGGRRAPVVSPVMPLTPEMGILRELSARGSARPDGYRRPGVVTPARTARVPLGKRPAAAASAACSRRRRLVPADGRRPPGRVPPAGWPGGAQDDQQEGEAKPRSGYPRCLAGGRLDHTRMTTL